MTDEQNDTGAEVQSVEPAPPPAESQSAEQAQSPDTAIREWKQVQAADSQPIDPTIRLERPSNPPPTEKEE